MNFVTWSGIMMLWLQLGLEWCCYGFRVHIRIRKLLHSWSKSKSVDFWRPLMTVLKRYRGCLVWSMPLRECPTSQRGVPTSSYRLPRWRCWGVRTAEMPTKPSNRPLSHATVTFRLAQPKFGWHATTPIKIWPAAVPKYSTASGGIRRQFISVHNITYWNGQRKWTTFNVVHVLVYRPHCALSKVQLNHDVVTFSMVCYSPTVAAVVIKAD